nr:immunoglobulin heavy chain junction region [Mus musculus]
CTRWELGDYW